MKNKPKIRCGSGVGSCSGDAALSYRLPRGPGLFSLRKDLRYKEAQIRFYYIDSVDWIDDDNQKTGLYQSGCGLNLKSKYATLCTCKRKMLKALHKNFTQTKERPIYIGVLGDSKGRPRNSPITPLVFLGKVHKSFDSFLDLWRYLPARVRRVKAVSLHPLGDLYSPALVRLFRGTGRIPYAKFAAGFVHAHEVYKKDLRESFPIVFKEWRAWPEGDVGFRRKHLKGVVLPKTFRTMVDKPRPSAYGWKYQLCKLAPVMDRVK
jgi:hypothetical protein